MYKYFITAVVKQIFYNYIIHGESASWLISEEDVARWIRHIADDLEVSWADVVIINWNLVI